MYGELTSRDTTVACTMHMKCWSSGCTIVLLSFTAFYLWISIQCLLILQKYSLLLSFIPSAYWCLQICISLIYVLHFKLGWTSDSGWSSDSDSKLLDGFQIQMSSNFVLQLSFSWKFLCSHLFFQNQYYFLRLINFSLWFCTLKQILAYPFELLIPCYHQNLKRHCYTHFILSFSGGPGQSCFSWGFSSIWHAWKLYCHGVSIQDIGGNLVWRWW